MIIEKKGNIFTTECQTIVNTINCIGVMGAGIAYEFRLREKEMFAKYKILCTNKQLDIGLLWIYSKKDSSTYQNILNFPTKYDWKHPSKEEYLHKGLQKFIDTYKQKGITSIAFPLLGADKGGINPDISLNIMKKYLSQCDIDIEIWHFDKMAKDDNYEEFVSMFESMELDYIRRESKIRIDKLKLIKNAIKRSDINSLSSLIRVKGVGEGSIEKLFEYSKRYKQDSINLFNI
jgi:O-acetyl-ADP-ribose deacetylase (regulator of RNase III)